MVSSFSATYHLTSMSCGCVRRWTVGTAINKLKKNKHLLLKAYSKEWMTSGKNNKMKRENKITELSEHCQKLYDCEFKPHLLYSGDTENTTFIIAIMVPVCLWNRNTCLQCRCSYDKTDLEMRPPYKSLITSETPERVQVLEIPMNIEKNCSELWSFKTSFLNRKVTPPLCPRLPLHEALSVPPHPLRSLPHCTQSLYLVLFRILHLWNKHSGGIGSPLGTQPDTGGSGTRMAPASWYTHFTSLPSFAHITVSPSGTKGRVWVVCISVNVPLT